MDTTTLLEPYRNESILNTASLEGGEWMRVLEAWCTNLKGRDMKTINTDTIIQFLEKFYTIHEKIHHRAVLILVCTMKDTNCIEEITGINNLNSQFLEEQKKLTAIVKGLRSKTYFGQIQTAWNTHDYMEYVHNIVDTIFLNWSVVPSGGIIFDPADSLSD